MNDPIRIDRHRIMLSNKRTVIQYLDRPLSIYRPIGVHEGTGIRLMITDMDTAILIYGDGRVSLAYIDPINDFLDGPIDPLGWILCVCTLT